MMTDLELFPTSNKVGKSSGEGEVDGGVGGPLKRPPTTTPWVRDLVVVGKTLKNLPHYAPTCLRDRQNGGVRGRVPHA